jgi:DNA-binding transcriptional ArsR family regulator
VAGLTSRDDDLTPAFRALGHHHRRNILHALRLAPRNVTDIAESLSLSTSATSKHLAVLTRAGLVDRVRRGQRQWYHPQDRPLEAVGTWLASTSAPALVPLPPERTRRDHLSVVAGAPRR